jgi:hypothetical protein
MVNKQELRLGNWVIYLDEPCKMNLGLFTHDLKSIKLTESILLSSGFTKDEVNGGSEYNNYVSFLTHQDNPHAPISVALQQ